MINTLLPAHEVDALCSLKATAFLLAVMIRLDAYHPGRAFRPEQIAPIVEMDERTVGKHLKSLSARNRVLLTASGYVLTEGGRAMFLPAGTPEALALSPDYQNQAQALLPKQAQAQAQFSDFLEIIEPQPADANTHNVCALEEGEESLNLNINIDSPSSSESNAQFVLNVRTVLEKTGMLFEKAVLLPRDLDEIKPHLALGWVAHAYDQREHLFAPWGLVYRRLQEGKEPRMDYVLDPGQFLPREYMAAIGYPVDELPEFEPVEPEDNHTTEVDEGEDCEAVQFNARVNERANGGLSAAQAWESVKGQLQVEMPKASFDTWVRDTRPLDYHAGTLTIGTRNVYARDWLADRLTSTCQPLLVGLLGDMVAVVFVVER